MRCLTSRLRADVSLRLAADAKQFHAELLDAVETLTAIAEHEAESLSFVRELPSGGRWWQSVKLIE